jgi:hypothetical protein
VKLFRSIAEHNHWEDPDSVSGAGSNLAQTEAIRQELPRVWAELGIRRLADVPCGDFYWMSRIAHHLDYYFGGDIVPEVVESARQHASSHCEFGVFDLMTDRFPEVDAVLARDGLVHLSNRDAITALRNVCSSTARYLITTTFPKKEPQDIITGDWRALNLNAPPFSLPEPVALINERCTQPGDFADKSLAIWDIGTLRGSALHLA